MQQASSEEPTITTITGKPITVPVAFRLATDYYQKLKAQAEEAGLPASELLQEWVTEKLNKPFSSGDRVRFVGSHPWAGYLGTYQGLEDVLDRTMHKVELEGGQITLADLCQLIEAKGTLE